MPDVFVSRAAISALMARPNLGPSTVKARLRAIHKLRGDVLKYVRWPALAESLLLDIIYLDSWLTAHAKATTPDALPVLRRR